MNVATGKCIYTLLIQCLCNKFYKKDKEETRCKVNHLKSKIRVLQFIPVEVKKSKQMFCQSMRERETYEQFVCDESIKQLLQ